MIISTVTTLLPTRFPWEEGKAGLQVVAGAARQAWQPADATTLDIDSRRTQLQADCDLVSTEMGSYITRFVEFYAKEA